MTENGGEPPVEPVDRAFGAANRARLLNQYFETQPENLSSDTAWQHVYRLLLWIDRTIGLAHCYESDKCQPGRPWYARSLRFHKWVSDQLDVRPAELARTVDWLFSAATRDLAAVAAAGGRPDLAPKAQKQREPFEHDDMPLPGEDPELEEIIRSSLAKWSDGALAAEQIRELANRIQIYLSTENKRKNLVGEGFEDTLAAVLTRIPRIAEKYDLKVRPALHEIPGFNLPRGGDKTRRVDLVLIRKQDEKRILVSCKWSIRSDREEQFSTDLDAYTRLESRGESFDYVLLTNEFDPARLASACEKQYGNNRLFDFVVHVNPAGPAAAYAAQPPASGNTSRAGGEVRAISYIASQRLTGLHRWIEQLAN